MFQPKSSASSRPDRRADSDTIFRVRYSTRGESGPLGDWIRPPKWLIRETQIQPFRLRPRHGKAGCAGVIPTADAQGLAAHNRDAG